MEEQHEIITPVLKSKQTASTSHSFVPRSAAKLNQLDVYKYFEYLFKYLPNRKAEKEIGPRLLLFCNTVWILTAYVTFQV